MLVTQTWREIVPWLPRFRIVAVSMQRLQVRRARITVVPIAMVPLNPVVMLEEPPTTATASVLLGEPPGQSCTDVGVSAWSRAPVSPVPILGLTITHNFRELRERPKGQVVDNKKGAADNKL